MTPAGAGALLGLLLAVGALLIWAGLPARRRPSLADRTAPYVPQRDATEPALEALLAGRVMTPFPTLERIVAPYLTRAVRRLERLLGGGASVRRRLDQVGSTATLSEFRLRQLLWAAAAAAVAIALSVAMLGAGLARSAPALVVFCCAAGIGGLLACDYRLSVDVRRRERRILAEFPTIADLLALAVAAGEGPVSALERVTRISGGELAAELRRALGQARTGTGLVAALDGVAERTNLAQLARFADGVAVALERGTPLAEVLRAQAIDVREAHRRWLLESGGRREVLMMIPVVFLVLPVTVAFALYPGVVQINAVIP